MMVKVDCSLSCRIQHGVILWLAMQQHAITFQKTVNFICKHTAMLQAQFGFQLPLQYIG